MRHRVPLIGLIGSGFAGAGLGQAREPQVPTTPLREWKAGPNGVARMALVSGDSRTAFNAFRIRYPDGFPTDTGAHYHLGTEHVVILKGTRYLGVGEVVDKALHGRTAQATSSKNSAGMAHFEWMVGEVEGHVEHVGPLTTAWLNHRPPLGPGSPARGA